LGSELCHIGSLECQAPSKSPLGVGVEDWPRVTSAGVILEATGRKQSRFWPFAHTPVGERRKGTSSDQAS
jgi:hypothetical protein